MKRLFLVFSIAITVNVIGAYKPKWMINVPTPANVRELGARPYSAEQIEELRNRPYREAIVHEMGRGRQEYRATARDYNFVSSLAAAKKRYLDSLEAELNNRVRFIDVYLIPLYFSSLEKQKTAQSMRDFLINGSWVTACKAKFKELGILILFSKATDDETYGESSYEPSVFQPSILTLDQGYGDEE